jgi:cytochrome c551/c552
MNTRIQLLLISSVSFIAIGATTPVVLADNANSMPTSEAPPQSQAPASYGPGYGMGPGMMGGYGPGYGMGPGMMSRQPTNETPMLPSAHTPASALLGYIRGQNLPCLQCHDVSTPRFGPAFVSVARYFAAIPNARRTLAAYITHGIGPMPAGLASDEQAADLAKLILARRPRQLAPPIEQQPNIGIAQ